MSYRFTLGGVVKESTYDFDVIQPKILKTLNKKELINVIVRQQDEINELAGWLQTEHERAENFFKRMDKAKKKYGIEV